MNNPNLTLVQKKFMAGNTQKLREALQRLHAVNPNSLVACRGLSFLMGFNVNNMVLELRTQGLLVRQVDKVGGFIVYKINANIGFYPPDRMPVKEKRELARKQAKSLPVLEIEFASSFQKNTIFPYPRTILEQKSKGISSCWRT